MASSLNASTSGGGGVIVTSDATGNLDIQSAGSTVVAVTSTGATVTGTLAVSGAVTLTGSLNTPNTFGFKNRIINGGMVIDQRNAGASVTNSSVANNFPVDRAFIYGSVSSKFTAQQSSTVPAGFTKSVVCTSLAATSLGATDYYQIAQNIEGFNVADLGWGTANAAAVTLSFWVRSSLTGTFGGCCGGVNTRSYPFTYTISVANTWEQKSITIAGDTAGTWGASNSYGIIASFSLGTGTTYSGTAGAWAGATYLSATGATSVVGTNGATFYITGVQLEKGSTATSFDFRAYSTELAMCQRYYQSLPVNGLTCITGGTNIANGTIYFPVTMRSNPTMSGDSLGRMTNFGFTDYNSTYTFSANITTNNVSSVKYTANSNPWSSTVGIPTAVNDAGSVVKYIYATAEL